MTKGLKNLAGASASVVSRSLSQQEALELRYDGSIPAQHLAGADALLRTKRGSLSVHEGHVAQYLDAAERAHLDIEELEADRYDGKSKTDLIEAKRKYIQDQIENAAESMLFAVRLRAEMDLPPHPITAMMSRIYGKLEDDVEPSFKILAAE